MTTRTFAPRRLLALLAVTTALAATGGAPRPALAHDTVRLSFGVANQWAWTDSVDALQGPNRFLATELRLGVGVWRGLSVEAGYRYLDDDGDTFGGSFETSTRIDTIDLAVRYDWPLLAWLSLYGRAGATAAHADVDVTWFTGRVGASAWTPGAFAGGGVGVRLPRRWFGGTDADGGSGFTVGASLDVGYAWFAGTALSGRPAPAPGVDGDREDAVIGQGEVDLGTLRVHGLTVQFGLTLHY